MSRTLIGFFIGVLKMKQIEDFRKWQSDDNLDIFEDMLKYFNENGVMHWWEIAKEANKFREVMFDDDVEIEDNSPTDDFHCAITSISATRALESVAYALGINVEHLEIALTTLGFYEGANTKSMPPAIGFDTLKKAVENVPAYLESNGEKPLL